MRAALYCRVSTEEQSERGFGLDAQRRILTEYCQREGYSTEFFVDAGISGETISARPEFQRLLNEAKSGRFDVVLAVDADRYSRASDLSDWQTIKRTFREAHIKWGTPSTWLNDAEFLTDVLSAVSADEKRKILARTLRGKLEAVRRDGRYFAPNAPYGYRLETGSLLVADDEAAIVRKMFKMALAGGTIYSISRSLTAEGVPTPMKARGSLRAGNGWQPSTVHGILHNRLYTGTAVWNRHRNVTVGQRTKVMKGKVKVVPVIRVENRPENEHIEVKVPALIDAGTFEAAGKPQAERQ
jgi:DNA invertase Pin-like site-specific DNA recombinase